jgi:Flp pilus assembly pilin Flp
MTSTPHFPTPDRRNDQRGSIAAEYGFLIVLIAMALVIALGVLGATFSTWLSDAADLFRP